MKIDPAHYSTTTRELTARHRHHAAFRGILTQIIVHSREIVSTLIDRGQLNGDPVPVPAMTPFLLMTPVPAHRALIGRASAVQNTRVDPRNPACVASSDALISGFELTAEVKTVLQNYTAKYTRFSDGYMGQLVEWPEVVTEGADLEECRALLRDALDEMLLAYRDLDKEIPPGNALLEQMAVELDRVGKTA